MYYYFVYKKNILYFCQNKKKDPMKKAFIYGMSVEGENFTDRELESKRLRLNFESGVNSILISPRRMGKKATEQSFAEGLEATLAQVTPLFVEQTSNLTAYQLNFIRAICQGYHDDFGKKEVTCQFDLGSRSNLTKLKSALIEREILEQTETGFYLADPLFQYWFRQEMM